MREAKAHQARGSRGWPGQRQSTPARSRNNAAQNHFNTDGLSRNTMYAATAMSATTTRYISQPSTLKFHHTPVSCLQRKSALVSCSRDVLQIQTPRRVFPLLRALATLTSSCSGSRFSIILGRKNIMTMERTMMIVIGLLNIPPIFIPSLFSK